MCPTAWDAAQLPGLQRLSYDLETYGDDVEHNPGAFDADRFIAEAVEHLRASGVDGVTSSGDYPGCLVAAFIARELGLPGPEPESVLRCSHKYYARLAQQAAVPEATPRFERIDPDAFDQDSLTLSFPLFVKPVKSWFSQYARRVTRMNNFGTSSAPRGCVRISRRSCDRSISCSRASPASPTTVATCWRRRC